MKVTVLAVGRLRAPFLDDVAHYEKLLSRYVKLDVVEVDDEEKLVKRLPERARVILLDDRGKAYRSEALAEHLEDWRQGGQDLCFVLGGAFGITLPRVDETIAFGPMTLPFQLARVVLLEQLYRAHKIHANEPYHH